MFLVCSHFPHFEKAGFIWSPSMFFGRSGFAAQVIEKEKKN